MNSSALSQHDSDVVLAPNASKRCESCSNDTTSPLMQAAIERRNVMGDAAMADHSGHSGDSQGPSGSECSPMMQMFFHGGYHEYFLFESFCMTTKLEFMAACLTSFLLGMLLEVMKVYRDRRYCIKPLLVDGRSCCSKDFEPGFRMLMCDRRHLLQTWLHFIQFWLGFCIMLVFMSFNSWLCLSLALGSAFGYYIVGWRKYLYRSSSIEDCCP